MSEERNYYMDLTSEERQIVMNRRRKNGANPYREYSLEQLEYMTDNVLTAARQAVARTISQSEITLRGISAIIEVNEW